MSTDLFGGISFYPEYAIITDAGCIPGPSGMRQTTIRPEEFVSGTNGLTYPQVGAVMLSNEAGAFTVPIIASIDGSLSYLVRQIPAGTYTVQAYLLYHHPVEPANVVRVYSQIWSDGQATSEQSISFTGGPVSRFDITLRYIGDVCAIN